MIETMSEFSKNINFFGMIHADLHSQNVLIQGKSLSVIDFDDAGFGWYGFDLAVAIWDRLDFTATGCHFDIAYQSLKKGYLGERPDTGDILETIPIFLLMRTLMIIRWIEDRPEAGYEAFIPVSFFTSNNSLSSFPCSIFFVASAFCKSTRTPRQRIWKIIGIRFSSSSKIFPQFS